VKTKVFEPWHTATYKAQCHTYELATIMGINSTEFRARKAYRSELTLLNRRIVALMVRQERMRVRLHEELLHALVFATQHNPKTGYMVDCELALHTRYNLNKLEAQKSSAYKQLEAS